MVLTYTHLEASMLLTEAFPDLSDEIAWDLRGMGFGLLAQQVPDLHIVDRCRCGTACGTFYTEPPSVWPGARSVMLDCGVNLMVHDQRILKVETLDPALDKVLRRIVP